MTHAVEVPWNHRALIFTPHPPPASGVTSTLNPRRRAMPPPRSVFWPELVGCVFRLWVPEMDLLGGLDCRRIFTRNMPPSGPVPWLEFVGGGCLRSGIGSFTMGGATWPLIRFAHTGSENLCHPADGVSSVRYRSARRRTIHLRRS